jgi:peroxiredoxin
MTASLEGPGLKRNIIVVAIVLITLSLLAGVGVVNYRQRQLAQQQEREHASQRMDLVPVGPQSSDAQSAAANGTASSSDNAVQADLSGKPAPEFALSTPDGEKFTLSDLRKQHKAVMINFWATWCVPCKVEMPWLIALQKQYASQGLQIIGVSEDDPPNAGDKVKKYVAKVGVEYPIVLDESGHTADHYSVQNFPSSYYVSSDGKIQAQTVGLVSRDEVETDIKKALAGGK